nr:MetaGeneMark_Unknown Function [uncultured bacterium]
MQCRLRMLSSTPFFGRMGRMIEQPPTDSRPTDDMDFLDRLRREELHVNTAELAGNPFESKATWRTAIRKTGTRGWAAGALAIAVLMLAWHLRPHESADEVIVASPDGIARLTAADPRALRQQIVAELHDAGVQAAGYEQLGVNGVDADLPLPTAPAVLAVLKKHRVPAPADGSLRIEIKAP